MMKTVSGFVFYRGNLQRPSFIWFIHSTVISTFNATLFNLNNMQYAHNIFCLTHFTNWWHLDFDISDVFEVLHM